MVILPSRDDSDGICSSGGGRADARIDEAGVFATATISHRMQNEPTARSPSDERSCRALINGWLTECQ